MSVLGTSDDSERFLKNLDEHKLVDLCADLLTIEGHSEIKITDGPGDGQRDIHSKNADGESHITQAKFHSDISRSVSAQELGEVVLGMARYGYRRGLFITNAKISPLAKRDGLDSYPGYSVDFIDGWELVKRVFGNLVLKAIWYDGVSLNRVSYALVMPTVARDFENDKPLPLLPRGQDSFQGNELRAGRTQVQARFQRSSTSIFVFGEYRSPRVRTVSELGSSRISMTEVVLSGVIYLEDISELLLKIGIEVISRLENMHAKKQHFAVLLGHPCLTPLGGEASGARIELSEFAPTTLVSHNSIVENELDWILPTQETGWFLPEYPKVSQAEWIQWYNPKYDVCLDVTVTSPPSGAVQWIVEEQSSFFVRWWNESLFMLLPTALQDNWEATGLPEPAYWYRWNSEKSLGVWLHPIFDSPIALMKVEPDHEPLEPFPFQFDLERVRIEISNLRVQVQNLGGVAIEPTKARHMIAILDTDPFPTTEIIEYQGRHLAFEPEIIPSPIDPNSRRVKFTVCWLVKALPNSNPPSASVLEKLADELTQQDYHPFRVTIQSDDQTLSKEVFLIAHVEYLPAIGFEKTDSTLQRIEKPLESTLAQLESSIGLHFSVERATEQYWDKEIFMRFRRG